MKKILSILLVLTLLLSFCTVNVSAEENIKVIIDITSVKFDVPPTIVNGRTLVPLRAIFEALGATVDWDDATQTVTSEKGGTKISLTINSNVMTVNGEAKTLDVPATLIDSRTLVPVRAISEAFGLQVGWDGEANIVSIVSNTEKFQLLHTADGRNRVFAKSSAAGLATKGWYETPVTLVYSAAGEEKAVAPEELQSYLDSGYYAYPVKTVYNADGAEFVIAASEFNAYIADGYLAQKPVAQAPVTDGSGEVVDMREEYIKAYERADEAYLAELTTGLFVRTLRDINITEVYAIFGGYYEGKFVAVVDAYTVENATSAKNCVCMVLNTDRTVTCVYGALRFYKWGDPRAGTDEPWAQELVRNRRTALTDFTSDTAIANAFSIARQ